MQVLICFVWHVKVDDHIDLLDIDSSTEEISGDHDSELALLELVVHLDSLGLLHRSEAGLRWEALLVDDFIQFLCVFLRLGEDDDLVKVEFIKQLNKLSNFLCLFKLHEILLESMKGKLSLLVDEELLWVLHVHSTYVLGLLGKSSREHHNLSVLTALHEDLLNLGSHV